MDTQTPITEEDIANYLVNAPEFFIRHAEVLAAVQMVSPHGGRTVSLQERQAEMLREKIKGLEQRIIDMVRHGNENLAIADKLQHWAADLLQLPVDADLPHRLASSLQQRFQVPQVALRLWDVPPVLAASQPWAQGASDDVRAFAASLEVPFGGANLGFEPVQWLAEPQQALSIALLPLRWPGSTGVAAPACGLLVLASHDPQRFQSHMGIDFLQRIAALAAAALGRLGRAVA